MHVLRVSAALAVVVLAAPRARAAEACTLPSAGDWHEYQSKHFTLVTDGGGVRATVAVQQLEELHALVVQALVGEQVEIPGRVRVIAFSDPSRFESLTGKWYVSGLATVSNLGELTIVYATEGLKAVPETVAHELAHHVSWYLFPRQPRWFSEGLAEFIQTVATERLDESSATGTHVNRGTRGSGGRWAGLAPREMLLALHSAAPLPSKELLEWRGAIDEANPARFHMSSWLLYHWLWNDRPKQFTSFQQRLSAGELPDAAWRAEFPEWDPARPATLGTLDEALERYRRAGRFLSYSVTASPDAAFTDASLPSADVHMFLLDMKLRWLERKTAEPMWRAEVEEVLREDPGHPVALWSKGLLEGKQDVAALRATAAARPRDWRAWYLLASGLKSASDEGEAERALRKAVALQPEAARPQNALAWALVTSGRAKEALPFANRALDLAPWDPNIVDTLAAVAMDLGKCSEALALQRRAADWYDPKAPAGDLVRKRAVEYEKRCAARAVAPAPAPGPPPATKPPAAPSSAVTPATATPPAAR